MERTHYRFVDIAQQFDHKLKSESWVNDFQMCYKINWLSRLQQRFLLIKLSFNIKCYSTYGPQLCTGILPDSDLCDEKLLTWKNGSTKYLLLALYIYFTFLVLVNEEICWRKKRKVKCSSLAQRLETTSSHINSNEYMRKCSVPFWYRK